MTVTKEALFSFWVNELCQNCMHNAESKSL